VRKLVSVRRCNEVRAIPGADRLDAVIVDGWQSVVQKGSFRPGDIGVYFEVDSFLPVSDSRYSQLFPLERMTWNDVIGIKVATRELRGQVTQGLFMPLADFPELVGAEVGDDVSGRLGIKKYERDIPAELKGLVKGRAPGIIDDTALERIQNIPDAFERWGEMEFEALIKLNGMSLTMFNFEGFRICSKENEFIDTDANLPWVIAREQGIPEALARMGGHFAIQGELIGHNIGSNRERVPKGSYEFHIFNVWNIDASKSLLPPIRDEFLARLLALGATSKLVPKLGPARKLKDFGPNQQALLDLATGPSSLYPGGRREGLVFRSMTTQDRFKVISNKFLLKSKE